MFQMGPRIQVSLAVMEYDEWEVSPSQVSYSVSEL